MPVVHVFVFFVKIFIQVFCSIFNQVVYFLILSLWAFNIYFQYKALPVIQLTNIFSHPVDYLLVLSIVSFAVWKFLIWLDLICLFLHLFSLLEIDWKKILLQFMSVFYLFSSRSFMVSGLVFRSFNSFWVNFCVWCEKIF